MLPETKAILFNIFRDYLASPEQKEKIINIQNKQRQIENYKKELQYNLDVFNKKNTTNKNPKKIYMELKKETVFGRIITKIKKF